MRPRRRRWLEHPAPFALLIGLLAFALLRASGGLPRALTADETDALLGAKILAEQLAPGPAPQSLKERLRAGFATTPTQPRLAALPADKTAPRAVLEAPLPRWLGALGLVLGPAAADASNLARASLAASLAVALALALMLWRLRREGWVMPLILLGVLAGNPGVLDAALSAGYGASALLVMALFLLGLDRLLPIVGSPASPGLGHPVRGGLGSQLWLGLVIGLALAIHPSALVLFVVVLVAYAIRPPAAAPAPPAHAGTLPLPSAPLMLFILPLSALTVLVLAWPALWDETGKRLGAWLIDYGSMPAPPHEVLGVAFEQSTGRAAQAFTAVLQWVAWTPLPVLGLWLVGFASAFRAGRAGAWTPILTLVAWLAVGALDGGLFGARGSLLALTWLPTALTAAHGARAALAFIDQRLRRRGGRLARLAPEWRAALFVALVLVVPILQSVRGTTLGLARQTGAELRTPVALGLLDAADAERRFVRVHAAPRPKQIAPALEAAREGLSLDLHAAPLADAELLMLTTASGSAPPPELARRLASGTELARDVRHGLVVSLWRLNAPRPIDP